VNLECRSEIRCTWLAENTGHKNDAKNRHLCTIAQLYQAVSSQLRHVSTIGKIFFKQQYVFRMLPQYGKLLPVNGWERLASFGHPSKFRRVSRLVFVTAATLLAGGQPNFARCLAISWAATLYIHFRGLLPPDGILPGPKFTLVQVLSSPTLAALIHGTPAAGVSQTLRRGTRNGITELLQRAPAIFGKAAITLGTGPRSSYPYAIQFSK